MQLANWALNKITFFFSEAIGFKESLLNMNGNIPLPSRETVPLRPHQFRRTVLYEPMSFLPPSGVRFATRERCSPTRQSANMCASSTTSHSPSTEPNITDSQVGKYRICPPMVGLCRYIFSSLFQLWIVVGLWSRSRPFFGSSGAGAVNLPRLRLRTKLKNNFKW